MGGDDEDNFKHEVLKEFNRTVGGNITKECTCNKQITNVEDMIISLSSEKGVGQYVQPDSSQIASTVCDLNGLPKGAERDKQMVKIIEEIQKDRKILEEELKAQRKQAEKRQREHDEMIENMQKRSAEQQSQMQNLIEETRKDAKARESKLLEELHEAKRQKRGFRISLIPPGISW